MDPQADGLAQAERYITQELKEYEEKILGADEKILILEARLFNELIAAMQEYIPQIQINANLIARMDCLLSFAKASDENRYVRPVIDDSQILDIKQGRHPVIELQLPIWASDTRAKRCVARHREAAGDDDYRS